MTLYCGIDLHSNNHVVVVIDQDDRRLVEKRLPNALARTIELLAPYRQDLAGIAVESTFNWYWLVDGLMDQGYRLHLVNSRRGQAVRGPEAHRGPLRRVPSGPPAAPGDPADRLHLPQGAPGGT